MGNLRSDIYLGLTHIGNRNLYIASSAASKWPLCKRYTTPLKTKMPLFQVLLLFGPISFVFLTADISCFSVMMTLICPDTPHQDTPQPRWDVWGTRYLYTHYIAVYSVSSHQCHNVVTQFHTHTRYICTHCKNIYWLCQVSTSSPL